MHWLQKTPNVDQLVVNLSGGNQQKVVIAKWLGQETVISLFSMSLQEVSTLERKNEIYKLMNQLAEQVNPLL